MKHIAVGASIVVFWDTGLVYSVLSVHKNIYCLQFILPLPEPVFTSLSTSPISNASLPVTPSPLSIRPMARDKPINFGSLTVPPSINGTPERQRDRPINFGSLTVHVPPPSDGTHGRQTQTYNYFGSLQAQIVSHNYLSNYTCMPQH